jgi:hypothetical protein
LIKLEQLAEHYLLVVEQMVELIIEHHIVLIKQLFVSFEYHLF